MRTILAALAALLTAARVASAANAPLPKDFILVNEFGKMSADWVLPSGHGQDCLLVVDPGGIPWLGCKGRFLESPSHAVLYMTDRPFDGLAWLPGGILLGVSGDQVGVFSIGDAAKKERGTAHVPFKPLGQYPGKKLAIYSGAGDIAYLVVSDEKGSEVVLLVRKKSSWGVERLLTTKHPVTAVTGTGIRTFVATGRRVTGLLARTGADKHLALDAQILFDHPDADVTALSYAPKLGIFYGTAKGTGYLGSRYHLQFLKAPDAKTVLSDGALYVLPSSGGVLKVSGMEQFLEKDAAMAAAGAPEELAVDGKK